MKPTKLTTYLAQQAVSTHLAFFGYRGQWRCDMRGDSACIQSIMAAAHGVSRASRAERKESEG